MVYGKSEINMSIQLSPHQSDAVDKGLIILREYGILYLALEMRLGKTLTALTICQEYDADSVLFVTKKNAIESVMSDANLIHRDYNVHVTNYEQVSKLNSDDYDLIILDESNEKISAFPKMSATANTIKVICKGKPIIFLSGTPTPESLSQIFHQLHMSDYSPFKGYRNFYRWAKDYVNVKQRMINGFPFNDYKDAKEDLIREKIDHLFISITQEQAGFKEVITDKIVRVPMSQMTRDLIKRIKKHKVIEGKTGAILADTPAKEMQVIHQLGSGTCKLDTGLAVTIDTSKAEYIKSELNEGKIAIFYNYIQEFELLKGAFPNWTADDKEFNESDDLVYLGQVVSKRSGVSLRTADKLIFFSVPFSATSYLQGRSRHQYKGRESACIVYFLIADCGIDRYVYDTVKGKEKYTTAHYRKDGRKEDKEETLF